ncbi:hypothetical protein [Streptomyces sp. MP131-18]|nr:hypothetical protein [Streptomyces sp. MP131-18]
MGMVEERLGGLLGQLVQDAAGLVDHGQGGEHPLAHGLLDSRGLA